MGDFQGLLASMDADPQRRGREFELVCKWFLENDPRYASRLEKVWFWRDWPDRWGADAGIDLVARTRDGHLWAIQSKAYARVRTVTKRDVDTFLSESSRPEFTYRLLISTTDRIAATARRTLVGQDKGVGHVLLTDLLDSQVDWPASPADLRPRLTMRKTPRPHQAVAVRDLVAALGASPRARLVMACGTGKTLTALFAAEALRSRLTLVLVPSLSLLSQTLTEWLANSREPMEFLAVCSDRTVTAKDRDAPVSTTSELGLPVTTDPDDIAGFLRRDGGQVHRVVFATYQSSKRIADAMAHEDVPAFHLAVADEAHRCAGPATGDFATILNSDQIRAQRRVFMTATPRYFTGRIIREAHQADLEVASMDDEATFGPLAHRLTFGQAICDGLLTGYRVAIFGIDDTVFQEWIERGRIVTPDGSERIDARTLAGHVGLARAIRKFDLRRTITFHNRVERAKEFARTLPEVIDWMPATQRPPGSIDARHVSGAMSAGQRRALLQRLTDPQTDRTLLANARCLTEGIDVPVLDGVAFIDPRRSEIDVVQAVGRAIRNAPDKKVGTIILPVFISDTDDPDTALNDSSFKTVWEVLNALRAHDEELAECLDSLRRELGRNPGNPVVLPRTVSLDLPARVAPTFAEAIKVHLVEQTTANWEYWYAHLEEFVGREGHALVPARFKTRDGIALGTWTVTQRQACKRGKMSFERRARLEELPGWSWDPDADAWEAGFAALRRYVDENGEARVDVRFVTATGFGLGNWVAHQRSDGREGRMLESRRCRLAALQGWVWDPVDEMWEQGFQALETFVAEHGHAHVHQHTVTADGLRLGKWVARCRQFKKQGRLSDERQARLQRLPGWTWDPVEDAWEAMYLALKTHLADGPRSIPKSLVTDDGLRLGLWVRGQRKQIRDGEILDERRIRLEALPGWTTDPLEERWEAGYAALAEFVREHEHAQVPRVHRTTTGFPLGAWVQYQKKSHKVRTLRPDRLARLEVLPGWSWDLDEDAWEIGFRALSAFVETHGHATVPLREAGDDGYRLGAWAAEQRKARNKGRLSKQRQVRLERLPGWSWDPLADQWEKGYAAIQGFVEDQGHARVPAGWLTAEGFALGNWVSAQKARRRDGKLTPERQARLESLPGWAWARPRQPGSQAGHRH